MKKYRKSKNLLSIYISKGMFPDSYSVSTSFKKGYSPRFSIKFQNPLQDVGHIQQTPYLFAITVEGGPRK